MTNCGAIKSSTIEDIMFFKEDYTNQISFEKYWENNSWNSPDSFYIENGMLKITTRAQTKDRIKVRTKKREFSIGTYTWKIFVPKFELYEQCSIGAFLYHSGKNEYEFDFEIGSGTKENRTKIKLKDDEAIVYCVSQFSPSNSTHFGVKMNSWSEFKMILSNKNGFYFVEWFINNQLVKSLQTEVKSSIQFRVHTSLENLHFMGNTLPTSKNSVLFDSFSFIKSP
jgi:hypothetical protein